jgi:hypothetical protein
VQSDAPIDDRDIIGSPRGVPREGLLLSQQFFIMKVAFRTKSSAGKTACTGARETDAKLPRRVFV